MSERVSTTTQVLDALSRLLEVCEEAWPNRNAVLHARRVYDAAQPGGEQVAFPPIERDERYDRDYIPIGAGYEVQTKGLGSSFRIAHEDDDNVGRINIQSSGHEFAYLEKMARAIHAERSTPRPASQPAKQGEGDGPDWSVPPCLECGAMTEQEASTKCICGGDKDECHGSELWPDTPVNPAQATIKDGAAQGEVEAVERACIAYSSKSLSGVPWSGYNNETHKHVLRVQMKAALAAAFPALTTEIARLREDAERYRWLRKEAYVITGRHEPGECGYDTQKEPVAMWIKASNGSADDKVDAVIDTAIRASRGEGL